MHFILTTVNLHAYNPLQLRLLPVSRPVSSGLLYAAAAAALNASPMHRGPEGCTVLRQCISAALHCSLYSDALLAPAAEAEEAAGPEDYTSIIFNLHAWSYRLSQQASSRQAAAAAASQHTVS